MDYQFRTIGKKCAKTGTELVPGSTCHSVLVEENGELLRFDYSDEGWAGPPPGTVGMWKSVVPKPAEPKRAPLDTNALLSCFEQMTEAGDPSQEKLRYILALLLLQKRRLRLDGSRQEGAESYLQLAGNQDEGAYEVRDLHLSDAEMHGLEQELNAHLSQEWA